LTDRFIEVHFGVGLVTQLPYSEVVLETLTRAVREEAGASFENLDGMHYVVAPGELRCLIEYTRDMATKNIERSVLRGYEDECTMQEATRRLSPPDYL
jgi:hypothetical protein